MRVMATRIRNESYTVDYAGFWVRFLAFLIDALILGIIIWLYNGIWGLATGVGFWGGEVADPLLPGAATGSVSTLWIMSNSIFFLIVVAYFVCFWAWLGRTPGKIIMKVRIVRFDGNRIGWGGAIMRFLGYVISILLFFLGFFWVAFDARRQGLHDKIADTFVITVPGRRAEAPETSI